MKGKNMSETKFKWDADSTAKALELWANRDESANSREVAAVIAEEIIGSRDFARRVIAKLTTEKVYVKPEKAKTEVVKEPTLEKSEIVQAVETQMNFKLGTIARGNKDDLVRFAELLDVTLPEPTVK